MRAMGISHPKVPFSVPNVILELQKLTISDKQKCMTLETIPMWLDAILKKAFFPWHFGILQRPIHSVSHTSLAPLFSIVYGLTSLYSYPFSKQDLIIYLAFESPNPFSKLCISSLKANRNYSACNRLTQIWYVTYSIPNTFLLGALFL